MSGVYQIYNPITNKRYIGSSIDVPFRLKTHHLNNMEYNSKQKEIPTLFEMYVQSLKGGSSMKNKCGGGKKGGGKPGKGSK